jgi:catechol 2,3-dioxygenase-like lactoylglutathione lyase family enzyme
MPDSGSGRGKSSRDSAWVASVAVMVSEAGRAKEWYTSKLGLSVLQDGEHWITVGRKEKGGAIHLCVATPDGFSLEPGNTGILVMVGGDLREECAKLKEQGVHFVHEPTKQPWGVWDAMIRDPDGNEILLMDEND